MHKFPKKDISKSICMTIQKYSSGSRDAYLVSILFRIHKKEEDNRGRV